MTGASGSEFQDEQAGPRRRIIYVSPRTLPAGLQSVMIKRSGRVRPAGKCSVTLHNQCRVAHAALVDRGEMTTTRLAYSGTVLATILANNHAVTGSFLHEDGQVRIA